MSLDVWLTVKEPISKSGTGVFVRDGGQTRELTLEEVKMRYPDVGWIALQDHETKMVFDYNITHNLNIMAEKAGVYDALWRPEERGWKLAKDIISSLEAGLTELQTKPEYYQQFNPANGWGDYEGLVRFVEAYLAACREYPDAEIGVSR